jgi:hypothetical protein
LTLVELIAALTVFALLVAVLTGLFRTSVLASEKVERNAERLDEMRHAHRFLRGAIEAARPVRWSINNRAVVAFDGDERELRFVSTLPPWPGRGGLAELGLRLDGRQLVLVRVPSAGEQQGFTAGGERDVLVGGVRAIRFAYFGREPGARQPGWHSSWRDRGVLPDLVRLDVEYDEAAGPSWPSLVVRPMLDPAPRS